MCCTIAVDTGFFNSKQIDKLLNSFKENGFIYSTFTEKNHLFIKIFTDSNDSKKSAARAISEFIYITYIKQIFFKAVDGVYYYFDKKEKDEAFKMLNEKSEIEKISDKLEKYLSENSFIEVKGFCDFRLREISHNISSEAEDVADDYLTKKEFEEFVILLKHFLDIQNSECEQVDVFRRKNGEYVLMDENRNKIPVSDCEISGEISDEILDIYDILLSELINLAPKRVIIHNKESFENSEILKTIESIFEKNVTFCDGCDMCKIFENEENNDE